MEQKKIRLLRSDEIECRIGTISEKGLSLLLYKDARADMKILDEVFGPLGWQRRHEMVGGNLYCVISVWDDEKKQWISKMDVGTESYTEKEKGQASDSFKRACVSLGIGRELYTAPFIWIPASNVKIQKKGDRYCTYDKFSVHGISYNKNREIVALTIRNQNGKEVYALSDAKGAAKVPASAGNAVPTASPRMEAINKELARTGVALDTVLQRYGVSSVSEMTDAMCSRALGDLKKTKSKVA